MYCLYRFSSRPFRKGKIPRYFPTRPWRSSRRTGAFRDFHGLAGSAPSLRAVSSRSFRRLS